MRRSAILLLTAALLAGCASHPRDTLLSLDMDSARFRSKPCREARQAALAYDDRGLTRGVVAVAGDLVAPFLGTAAAMAMSKRQDPERQRLNKRLAEACMEDPLGERARHAGRAGRS